MTEPEEKICRSSKTQILAALLASVPTFTYGIQIGWISPMSATLKSADTPTQDPVTNTAISWMTTALPLAAIAGIPFFSFSSDTYGRKPSIIALSILSSISWLIMLIKPTSISLIVARTIAGLAAGGCFVVIPVYIKEISEDSWRGTLGSLVMTVCKLGVIVVYTVGMCASYYVNQSVYLSIAILHAVCFCFIPESPVFLVRKGYHQKAKRSIAWLRNVERSSQLVIDEIVQYKTEDKALLEAPTVTVSGIVRDPQVSAALRMTLTLMGMQTLSGCFMLMSYAAEIFSRAGTEWSPNVLAIFVGSFQLAGSFFTTISIDRFGRKIPLASSSLVVGVCMTVLATYFLVGKETWPAWVPVVAVCLCILSYGAGLAPVPFVIMSEVFSFQLRAKLAGVVMAFSFLCSSSTVLSFDPIAKAVGVHVVFYACGMVGLLGSVYTVFYVPETKGKSLEEIKRYWKPKDCSDPTPL